MSYSVSADDRMKLSLNETDKVSSVLQGLRIILSTFQGSVPLYRDFGISPQSIDKPIPVARNMLIIDIEEAVRRFEPRAVVLGVTFKTDPAAPEKLIPVVEVDIP